MRSRVGKYTVERELGHGGFGTVYLAFDPDVKRPVAIKLIENVTSDRLKYFLQEIPTTGRLAHKNIVTLYDSGADDGNPYLVMELLDGQNLREVIRSGRPLSLVDKVRIMTQVAEGLAYAHSKGIVHRDVKPENIMLLADGSVKIMDFGIALAPDRTTTLTQTGGLIGTPRYLAPEQIEGYKANEQTDIFSFGVVYYELLAGVHPFHTVLHDWVALQSAIMTQPVKPLTEVAPGIPESLELLVERTLAKDRQFRYKAFGELVLDSEAILADLHHEIAAGIVSEAHEKFDAGDVTGARVRIREAQRLDPGNRDARKLLEAIDQSVEQGLKREQAAKLAAQAGERMAERRFQEAVQLLEAASRLDGSSEVVRRRLPEAQARLDGAVRANRLVEEARSRQQKGELSEALERLQAALQADPDHTEAKRLAPRVAEQLEVRKRDRAATELLARTGIETAATRVREFIARDAVRQARAALDEARAKFPNEAVWTAIEREIDARQQRQADVVEIATRIRGASNAQTARRELEAGRQRYPDEALWATLQPGVDAIPAAAPRETGMIIAVAAIVVVGAIATWLLVGKRAPAPSKAEATPIVAETRPPEIKPPETKPPETKPPETKPPETKPPETKPVEAPQATPEPAVAAEVPKAPPQEHKPAPKMPASPQPKKEEPIKQLAEVPPAPAPVAPPPQLPPPPDPAAEARAKALQFQQDLRDIGAQLSAYQSAYNDHDMNRVRQIFPRAPDFSRSPTWPLTTLSIARAADPQMVDENRATVDVTSVYSFQRPVAGVSQQTRQERARFRRVNGKWVIESF
jgi:hypothetical protein